MSETGRPGRYSRSFNGLLGALIVTVVAVVGVAAVRAFITDSEPFTPEPVDYLATVAQIQDGRVDVVYPPSLPEGWIATDVDFRPGPSPSFSLSALTDDGRYVGLQEQDAPLEELLRTYVDENYRQADPLSVEGGVARRWSGYSDAGGDTAYAAEVGGRQVLVFGSASPEQLAGVVRSLTAEPVGG